MSEKNRPDEALQAAASPKWATMMQEKKHREAAEWVVRRDVSESDNAMESKFQRWLDAHPDNRRNYEAVQTVWGETGALANDPELRALLEQDEIETFQTSAERRSSLGVATSGAIGRLIGGISRRAVLAGAAVLGVLAAAILVAPHLLTTGYPLQEYRTAVGEQRTVSLPDGSAIFMNTDTRLSVAYSKSRRTIDLLRGEAQFDVAHDTSRPFVVKAAGKSVQAVGTQFVVYYVDKALSVTVLQGTIRVNESAISGAEEDVAQLTRGQEIRYVRLDAKPIIGEAKRLENIEAWRSGRLLFDNETLRQVVADLNRYGTTKVVLADDTLADIRVSGVFRIGETESVLKALKASFPINVVRGASTVFLTRKTS